MQKFILPASNKCPLLPTPTIPIRAFCFIALFCAVDNNRGEIAVVIDIDFINPLRDISFSLTEFLLIYKLMRKAKTPKLKCSF